MTVNIFLQSQPEKGYIATTLEFPNCIAEGKTREEALKNAKALLLETLSQGEWVSLQIEPQSTGKTGNPWIDNFGRFKDDPTFDDLLAQIETYRRELVQHGGSF